MKVSINWLKELIDLKVSIDEIIRLLPLRTIGLKEVTEDFFELDMKGYNRADLLSLRGVAYETAAITDSQVTFEETSEKNSIWTGKDLPKTETEVKNEALAPLYCVAKIEGLRVDQSTTEVIKKLEDSGMRSVNNIADVTNLIMLEYGQPLHAFDADTVSEGKIIVRCAKEGEGIVTLDGKNRKLTSSDLLITDPKKALGIAGVMGGKNSEVTDNTTTIFLEAAIFDPINLRKTASRLNLPSEASKRFQHGLTKKRCLQALDAAIKMYQELGGVLTAISITGNLEDPVKEVVLRKVHMDSLIGIEIPEKDVENYLQKLNFQILASEGEALRAWKVIPPYYRLDIEIEADVIEEVARMYGYEKIPPKELVGEKPKEINQSLFELIYNTKVALADLGFSEVQTYSFYSTQVINNFNINKDELIKVLNPMSSETEYMRNFLMPNITEAVAKNLKNGFEQVAIFEIGKTYKPKPNSMPDEAYKLSIALSNNNSENIKQLYALFQNSCSHMECGKLSLGNQEMNEEEEKLFHPVRFWQLTKDGKRVGHLAEVHPRIVNKFGVEKRIAILEIDLTGLQLPQYL